MDVGSIEVNLFFEYGYKWSESEGVYVKGYAFDENNLLLQEKELQYYFNDINNLGDFENKIRSLNGQFSIIYNRDEMLYLAVDPCRNFPLFYSVTEKEIRISDSVEMLLNASTKLLEYEKEEFLATGFVTNKFTLAEGVFQLQAGSIIYLSNKKLHEKFYHHFAKTHQVNKKSLENNFEIISERLFRLLDGRTAVIPLSGGYDSRLIACILKTAGYKKVICYSFGISLSEDVKMSRKVAEVLGFQWIFIPCDEERMKGFPDSEFFEKYYSYSSNYVSSFFTQDYFAVKYLNENNIIPADSVFIPGHSGDMISGSHLFKGINGESLLAILYKKHYNFNNNFNNNFEKFIERIQLGLTDIEPFENFENWNLKERQAKFIINSCRVYEFFGYEYYLPLWDKDLMSFFENATFEDRIHQKLYIKTIFKQYFEPLKVDFKKVPNNEFFIKYFIRGVYRRLMRIIYTDDMNCKLTAKKLIKNDTLKIQWNSMKININEIISVWYIKQIEKNHGK